ncbi:HVA1 family protein [Chroococcidiopsis sp.]|uniref:HVA1 family protein n=1 Tax=Chroococcidiopsis sp. TaxID=3088168 RepID=UPI003F32556E
MTSTLAEKLLVLYRTSRPLEYTETSGVTALEWSQSILKRLDVQNGTTLEKENLDSPSDYAESKVRVGTTVSWKYGSGTATGKVIKVYRDRITLKLGDSEITRNGSEDDPALLIKQENGAKVLKLFSEVRISTSDYADVAEAIDFKTAPAVKPKGIRCGNSYISAKKTCKIGLTGDAAKAADYLDAKVPKAKAEPNANSVPLAQTGTTAEERKQFIKDRPQSKSRLPEAKKAVKKIPGAPPPHPEEVMALQEYTGLSYGAVNAALRGNDATVLAKPLTAAQKTKYLEDAKFASAALDALPNYEGTVYRGAALPKSIVSQYQVGKTITEKAFTSTSGKPDVADNFAVSGDGAIAVKYTIASKKGKSIKSLSAVPGEEEILFNANTQFKVLANKTKIGITHIYLEEV